MSFRDTASFGKRQEFSVVTELLKRGFDVYLTLVDDRGIDCIIRLDNKRYLDVQIKARSKDAQQGNLFAGMSFEARENFYFIFYTEWDDTFWIIPSKDVEELGSKNKSGKNAGKISLTLLKTEKGDKARKFEKYKNDRGFNLLREYGQTADNTNKREIKDFPKLPSATSFIRKTLYAIGRLIIKR